VDPDFQSTISVILSAIRNCALTSQPDDAQSWAQVVEKLQACANEQLEEIEYDEDGRPVLELIVSDEDEEDEDEETDEDEEEHEEEA